MNSRFAAVGISVLLVFAVVVVHRFRPSFPAAVEASVSPVVTGQANLPRITDDGRLLFFMGVLPDDVYRIPHLFVHDRTLGTIQLVSTDTAGVPEDGLTALYDVSDDGRFVVFSSTAANLEAGQDLDNSTYDVFFKDLVTGETRLLSPSTSGYYPTISGDGRWVAYQQSTESEGAVVLYDALSGSTRVVSRPGERAAAPKVSDDGACVAYQAYTDPEYEVHGSAAIDIYLRHMDSTEVELVSVDETGSPRTGISRSPVLSGDCSTVSFQSLSGILAENGMVEREGIYVWKAGEGRSRFVAFSGTTEDPNDFRWGATLASSLDKSGTLIAFKTPDPLLLEDEDVETSGYSDDVYVLNLGTSELYLASDIEDFIATNPFISSNGSRVTFEGVGLNEPYGAYVYELCLLCEEPSPTPAQTNTPTTTPPTPSPTPPPNASATRKVIILSGIDTSASCSDLNDGVDQLSGAIRRSVMEDQRLLADPQFSSVDFIQFSWGGKQCQRDRSYAEFSREDTCIGAAKGADRLNQLISTLPKDSMIDLIGWSLGGVTASYWASLQTKGFLERRVHSVILLDSPVRGVPGLSQELADAFGGTACSNRSRSWRDLEGRSNLIGDISRSGVDENEAFVSILCTSIGGSFVGSWKVLNVSAGPDLSKHDCGWRNEDALSVISLSLFETFVDDSLRSRRAIEPSPGYFSGWIEDEGASSMRRTLHRTRDVGRRITLEFTGGEIVLVYRCAELVCAGPAPHVQITVDGTQRVEDLEVSCSTNVYPCTKNITGGLGPGTHNLRLGVTDFTTRRYFAFDGFVVCPVLKDRSSGLRIGRFECGDPSLARH